MYDFDTFYDRRDTGSNKWTRYPSDVLPMWVADMDFPVAAEIVDAIRARLDHPVLGYGVAPERLRHQIVADMKHLYGWTIESEDIVFLPGVEPGFNMALKALLSPGNGVVVQTPAYRPILDAPGHWGLERVEARLEPQSGSYAMNEEVFETALGKAGALLFCNPHNPTGKVFTPAEVAYIADACERHDMLIISDEIHCDLLFDGRRHTPIASLSPQASQRTVTLMSAAKTYNTAGLKTAFAIIQNPDIRKAFSGARLGMVDSVNVLGLEATLAAFASGNAWKTGLIACLQDNRDYLFAQIASRFPDIRTIPAQGTFLAWLDCTALDLAPDPQAFFLEKGRVAFSAGDEFGADYTQFIRFNFGCPRALIDEGLDRMEKALAFSAARAFPAKNESPSML